MVANMDAPNATAMASLSLADGHADTVQQPRKRHAKLFHKKSRTGCQRCRARRVKCDEGKPICYNCTRLELDCVYGNAKPPSSQGDSPQSNSSGRGEGHVDPENLVQPVETETRRKLELELFYHYTTVTGPSLHVDKTSKPLWGPVICRTAFQSDAVLFSVILLAALHKAYLSSFNNLDLLSHCSTYLQMALQEHHKHVAHLNAENVDFSCLASSALRVYGFVRLQDRSIEPYTPPMDWLRISNSSNITFRRALDLAKGLPDLLGSKWILQIYPLIEERENMQHLDELMHLLRRQEPHELEEEWDEEVCNTYKGTLSCLGGSWKHRHDVEPPLGLTRRLIVFPMVVDKQFLRLVQEQRPRALVILAHYFALLVMLRGFWWVGESGIREAWAIAGELPPEWQGMISEPLEMIMNPSAVYDLSSRRDK